MNSSSILFLSVTETGHLSLLHQFVKSFAVNFVFRSNRHALLTEQSRNLRVFSNRIVKLPQLGKRLRIARVVLDRAGIDRNRFPEKVQR